jgi:hypothetical protein
MVTMLESNDIMFLTRKQDTKRVFRSSKSKKERQYNGQTMMYKTLHRELKIEQGEHH